MYDLILCVLATTKNKRLAQFLEIGYKKTDKYKTKIVYLVNNEEKPDFIKDEWFNCPDHPVSTRFSYYLSETKDKSRWFMHVDDDSCTDMDKTIELLDYFYNNNDPIMLTGSSTHFPFITRYLNRSYYPHLQFSYTLDPNLQNVIKKMKIENLFVGTDDLNYFETSPRICHGWENSIFSSSAVDRLVEFPRLKEYINFCLEFECKFGDEVPFVLAKIAKVPICNCYFLSPLPEVEEYTAINKSGRFSHIHHVAEPLDVVCKLKEIINNELFFENKNEVANYLENSIDNTEWIFIELNQKVIARCIIKFCEDKTIELVETLENINMNYEKFNIQQKKWKKYENNISLVNEENKEFVFEKKQNKLYLAKNLNSNFILSKLDRIDKIYLNKKIIFHDLIKRIS